MRDDVRHGVPGPKGRERLRRDREVRRASRSRLGNSREAHDRATQTSDQIPARIPIAAATIACPGDFVNVPRGTVHRFRNTGTETARLVLTFTPAGIEHWFEETLERAPNDVRDEDVPDNVDEVAAR